MFQRSGLNPGMAVGARWLAMVIASLALANGAVTPHNGMEEPDRVLVAPADSGSGIRDEPLVQAASAVLAEVLAADGKVSAALLHDISVETMEALDFDLDDPPGPRRLTRSGVLEKLRSAEGIRVVLLPEISSERIGEEAGFEVGLRWIDTVKGDEGVMSDASPREAGPFLDLLGRLAAQAHTGWRSGWSGSGPPPDPAAAAALTSSPRAAADWALGRAAWCSGGVPRAEKALERALESDPEFGRAQVDLAWILLARGLAEKAGSLAAAAVEGGRLSTAALEEATLIRIASTGDGDALVELGAKLEREGPGFPRADLSHAMGLILRDEYAPSISLLDRVRRHRPNDPAVVHLAGIAGLGAQDYFEAETRLSRAAALWPGNELIRLDLAETAVRNRDLEGAAGILEEWAAGFHPGTPPVSTEHWSVANPPPPVRADAVHSLRGRISVAADELQARAAKLELDGAGWRIMVPVLYSLHGMEMQLSTLGAAREKQAWLNRARDSLRKLDAILPDEERQARPWVYDRLAALLRVREGRVQEAREIREMIMDASEMPGYDPGVEAEIDAAITLKEADAQGHFAACRRGIEVRGLISDHYRLAQAYAVVRDWPRLDDEYETMRRRLEEWSVLRRRDTFTWSPMESGYIPFIYYVGALARMNQGDAGGARSRFRTFLAYFKDPDPPYRVFRNDAADRGAKPAW